MTGWHLTCGMRPQTAATFTHDEETVLNLKLHTAGLSLEPLDEARANALFAGLRGEALHFLIPDLAPESLEALARRFHRLVPPTSLRGRESWLNWALLSAPGDRHVGLIQASLRKPDLSHVVFVPFDEICDPRCARETAGALIDHLYSEWGLSDIWATVDAHNRRGISLLERLGFLRIAVRENTEVTHGSPSDELVYCLSLAWHSFAFLT